MRALKFSWFFIFIIFVVSLLAARPSEPTEISCSPVNQNKLRINELFNPNGSSPGYIELYVNDTNPVNITGWTLSYYDGNTDSNITLGLGNGDVYFPDGNSVKDGIDSDNSSTFNPATFLVYSESLFGRGTSFGQSSGEILIRDNTNSPIHYIRYYNNNYTPKWNTSDICQTTYDQANASNVDLCSMPDGQIPEGDWANDRDGATPTCSSTGTMGYSNLGNDETNSTTFSLTNNTFIESASIGTLIGNLVSGGSSNINTSTYEIVSVDNNLSQKNIFSITNDELKTNTTYDYDVKNQYTILIAAYRNDGSLILKNFILYVQKGNSDPVIGVISFSVNENQTIVGNVNATDPDGDSLTYSISGDDATLFNIDSSGNITFKTAPDYNNPTDLNGDNIYTFIVRVDDGKGGVINQVITITVTKNVQDYTCPNPRDFSTIFSQNIKGNIKIFGNTIMCKKNGSSCAEPGDADRNNDIDMIYADYDTNLTTFSSTSSNVVIPANSTIEWAGLYWQGMLYDKTSSEKNTTKFIKLSVPGKNYVELTADTHNWIYYGGDSNSAGKRFYYQGYKNISSLVSGGGTFWVADLVSEIGKPAGGSFGGWAIVIVYKNSDEKLNNITIFDGFQAVMQGGDVAGANSYFSANNCTTSTGATNNLEKTVSGFLTPANGSVNSTFLFFAGEGDAGSGTGDKMSLTNKSDVSVEISNNANANNNILNASISYFGEHLKTYSPSSKTPDYKNNLGIDIDVFDISSIINNSQTSTKIKLTTEGDGYQPAIFAFSTELYVPDVCYEEQYYKNGALFLATDNLYIGDVLKLNVTISNKSPEVAKKVQITKTFDSYQIYQNGTLASSLVGESNISSKTDLQDSDVAEYVSGENKIYFRLGSGATSSSGGDIGKDEDVIFSYEMKINSFPPNGEIINAYKVSYVNDVLNQTFDDYEIGKCSDRSVKSTKFNVKDPTGSIRVIRSNSSGWNDYELYSQMVGQPFDIKLAILNDSNATISKIEIIDENDGSVISTIFSTTFPFTVTGTSSTIAVTINEVGRSFYFKVTDSLGFESTSQNFSVRPPNYTIDINSTSPYYAGNSYLLEALTGYPKYDGNASFQIGLNQPCPACTYTNGNFNQSNGTVVFSGGKYTINPAIFDDVGVFDINFTDTYWTYIDQNNSGCIVGSSSVVADVNGKYGCNIEKSITVTILPDNIGATITEVFVNSRGIVPNDWTFVSNPTENNISFKAFVSAKNLAGNVVKNFTNGAFAENVDVDLNLTVAINGSSSDLNWTKIYNSIHTQNQSLTYQPEIKITFNILANEFNEGISPEFGGAYNFKRDSMRPVDPIILKFINLVGTSLNVIAKEFPKNNFTDGNNSAAFLYARINVIDSKVAIKALPDDPDAYAEVKIYYEIYSSNKSYLGSYLGVNPQKGVDSQEWWILNNTIDNYFPTPIFNSASFNSSHTPYTSTNNTEIISNGVGYNLRRFNRPSSTPSKVRVKVDFTEKNNFLYYNPYSGNEQFYIDYELNVTDTPHNSNDVVKNNGIKGGIKRYW